MSTATYDHVPLPDGSVRVQRGGPAHYIGQALDELGVSHRLITGAVAEVDVIRDGDGERYAIPPLPEFDVPSSLDGDAVILSPIMREIRPDSVPPVCGLLAIDLQGFVRCPGDAQGRLDRDVDVSTLLARSDIIKASEEELAALDLESRRLTGRAVLLITLGRRGAIIRRTGQQHVIEAEPVAVGNTIGAGDTFLAAFVVETLRGASPQSAAESAARFTECVLRRRIVS